MFWDYIFLIRPTLLVPVWTFFLIGYARGGGEGRFFLSIFAYSLLMGGVYILNQIVDRETDRINKKLFLLSEGIIPLKHAWCEMIVLFVASLTLSFLFPVPYRIFFFISFIFGILYSAPPARFKGRPLLDLFSNAFGYGVLNFGIGYLTSGEFTWKIFLYSLPYFFAVGGVFINTTIPDIPGDREAGEITTGVWLGEKKCLFLSTIFIFISLVLSIILKDILCLIAASVSLPLFLYALLRPSRKSVLISIRIGAPILTLAVCFLYPLFFPVLLLLYLSMRIYYKKRFNYDYPTLTR
ncbi:hypothetical protein DRQ20_03110 [bacterium]|nr:MAG: hypothetical protein DRQ20_03110 [bacterium]